MGIVSLKNKIQKRIIQEESKKDYQEIGTFIKKRRRDLNLTQDTLSNGICSVSYLSKIENNQIEPNEMFVREIMVKLDVDDDFLDKNIEDQRFLERTIQYVFYFNINELKELNEEIIDINDNLTLNICKFGYEVFTKSIIPSEPLMQLENLVMNMTNLELNTYLLFSSIYFMSYGDYKTALELLMMSLELHTSNEYLKALLHEYTYYVKQRLLKKNSSLQHYDEALRFYIKYLNNNRTMTLSLNKIKHLSDENPKLAYKHISTIKINLLSNQNLDLYYYVKGYITFLLERYSESTICLSHIKDESELHVSKLVLLYEICLIEDDREMRVQIKKLIHEYKMNRKNMTDKVYYHFLNESDEEDIKEYLRDIAIPYSIKTSDYKMLQFYTDKIMDICINNSRYKEATQYYKKYNKELEKVEKILYKV